MSTQIDSLGLYNNPYALNYQDTARANDDFLAQQYFAQQAGQIPEQYQSQPVFQGYQQPQADTFQKSGSSSNLSTGLALGSLAGAGTGAGIYFFGSNPIKDGKVDETLIKTINKEHVKNIQAKALKELYEQKAKATFDVLGVKDLDQYNAIKKLAKATKLEDLPEETRKLLPDSIKTPKDAKDLVDLAKPELDKIDAKKLISQVDKFTNNTFSLDHNAEQLKRLEGIKAKIDKLPKDAKVADLEKFFIDNAETFNLKGTNPEIAAKAKRIAAHHGSKESLLNLYQGRIDAKKQYIESIKSGITNGVKDNWDDTAKALKKDAPEVLTKAFKNFKWTKVAKGAGIAAAVGLVLGCLFGNGKKEA